MYMKHKKYKRQTHTRMCIFAYNTIYIIGHIVPPRSMYFLSVASRARALSLSLSLSLPPSLPPSLSRARALSLSPRLRCPSLSRVARARALSLSGLTW
jgi:hypothetical protein